MPRAKQESKRKTAKKTVPVLGAAGLSLLAGGASAATVPVSTADSAPTTPNLVPNVVLSDEEVSDVNLSTFYVFDKEASKLPEGSVQEARGCGHGCGGCGRGCGCRGCGRGCGCRCAGGCGCGCGGCGGCWCFPWPLCAY